MCYNYNDVIRYNEDLATFIAENEKQFNKTNSKFNQQQAYSNSLFPSSTIPSHLKDTNQGLNLNHPNSIEIKLFIYNSIRTRCSKHEELCSLSNKDIQFFASSLTNTILYSKLIIEYGVRKTYL